MVIASEPKYFKHHWKELWKNTVLFLTTSLKGSRKKRFFYGQVKKTGEKSGQADRFGGGVTPLQPDRFYLWKF